MTAGVERCHTEDRTCGYINFFTRARAACARAQANSSALPYRRAWLALQGCGSALLLPWPAAGYLDLQHAPRLPR
jgi:hypothetical protein